MFWAIILIGAGIYFGGWIGGIVAVAVIGLLVELTA
jgi:hypothetical protein